MSDTKPDTEQTSLTNRPIVAGTPVSSTDHEAWRNDIEGRTDDLIAGLRDNSNHRAGTSAPTDNAVEGQIWFDGTTDPGIWKGDPDGSGADSEFHNSSRWPAFLVNMDGTNQDNISGIDQLLWLDEVFDTNSNFSSHAFTPTVAGKYLLTLTVKWLGATLTPGDAVSLFIFKGGSNLTQNTFVWDAAATTLNSPTQTTSIIVDANGTTDSFTAKASNNDRNTSDINGSIVGTFFMGVRVA